MGMYYSGYIKINNKSWNKEYDTLQEALAAAEAFKASGVAVGGLVCERKGKRSAARKYTLRAGTTLLVPAKHTDWKAQEAITLV
jgi:hypothetical protein